MHVRFLSFLSCGSDQLIMIHNQKPIYITLQATTVISIYILDHCFGLFDGGCSAAAGSVLSLNAAIFLELVRTALHSLLAASNVLRHELTSARGGLKCIYISTSVQVKH